MRVGYVLKRFPRLSQTFVLREILAHERAGQPLVVFSLRPGDAGDAVAAWRAVRSPVVTVGAAAGALDEDALAARLAEEVRARRIDHLHAHFANVATAVARTAARETGIPYSFTAHARDIYAEHVSEAGLRERMADAARIVTVSRFNAAHLATLVPAARGRVTVVENGLDLGAHCMERPARRPRVVLGVGRLVPKKGFADLVMASGALDAECWIAGDGPERASLERLARSVRGGDRVRFLGAVPPETVRALLHDACVLAVPSVVAADGDRDGLPTVLLEAMASGTPCVATRITGIPEVVEDGVTGLLVPPGDPDALAAACTRLLGDAPLRVGLAERARALVEERFDAARTSARLRSIWRACVGASRRPQVLFRVSNRRGLGHFMRAWNTAHAVRALAPGSEVVIYSRRAPPFVPDDPHVRCIAASRADVFPLPDDPALSSVAPDVVVDDTILPERDAFTPAGGPAHAFVLRRCTDAEHADLVARLSEAPVEAILVPHTPEEFTHDLPPEHRTRATFTGPIVREPDPQRTRAYRARFAPDEGSHLLVSTPGGGGFGGHADRFFTVVWAIHRALTAQRASTLHHVVVRGPHHVGALEPLDGMTVLDTVPDMPSLLAAADAVIAAGGYNSVQEIRLAAVPAFLVASPRRLDDQWERVERLATSGAARAYRSDAPPEAIARDVAAALCNARILEAMRAAARRHRITPGNDIAAERLLALVARDS